MSVTVNRYVETTPDIRGGRPRIADTRMTVAEVVLMYLRLGQSLEEIAGRYDLPLSAVYVTMVYYYNHRSGTDRSIMEDRTLAEAFRNKNVSPLQAKLQSMSYGLSVSVCISTKM